MDEPLESGSPSDNNSLRNASTLGEIPTRLHTAQVLARRYEIVKRAGRGGMGEVWQAYDVKLRVDVALKSVRRASPESVEAMRREVRTAREVISPNVCRIFDLVVEEGQEYVSMEYIDGQTLLELLRDKSPLDLRQAHELASQFLAGLEAIHIVGLVHRDIKPENIMITRTGRVVVMDFGIAKPVAQVSGTITGTPPYMSPEQLAGGKVDLRADVFAAGVLLAEMISTTRDRKSREMVWNSIRDDPPKLPDSPWQTVIARAVARNPDDRFSSAGALARALEEVTQRVDTVEERKPYPGLSSFTEGDAEYFFGRELEAETVLKKLQELHLMAIIGPSGGGKTSFLRAGLIPVLPLGLSHVFTVPGDSPLVNLGQALAAEFSGDTEAIRKMVRLEDMDVALWLLHRWRQKHSEALLIVDRFEELFTLNDRETQSRFAELLGRAVLEADVRLLLAMRDDFLIFCKEHASLAPIFSDLTALLPLTGPALRRALIQPALQSGYRFEDEVLVDDILNDVERERGALPLMAFAAARLWEKRDRKNGLFTRVAYQQIGGVAGALAQHAEATMDRIGTERHPIVREIFRNLITAQNTRAARDTEEILSIFENRQTAEEVLRSLVDARLLSTFEAPAQEGEKPRRRVEIIHESLLSAWPRLVRWQTQDADSLQFRDQLRQAAHGWDQRGRPPDLLWTGASYKEFEVWREKYSGGLASIEKSFADAMSKHARIQRRNRRAFVGTAFLLLLGILFVIAGFWRSEKSARQSAVSEAQRAEASKLLALGQNSLEQDSTIALAYAIASLQKVDTPVARRFALEALWKGPPVFIIPDMPIRPVILNFNRQGTWLGVGGAGGLRLLPSDGKGATLLEDKAARIVRPRHPQFSPNGDSVAWNYGDDTVRVWSISRRKEIRRFKVEGESFCWTRASRLMIGTKLGGTPTEWEKCRVRFWSYDENEPRIVGDWTVKGLLSLDMSNDARWMTYPRGRNLYIRPVENFENAPEQFVGNHDHKVERAIFHPSGREIVSADSTGEIRMWSISQKSRTPFRKIAARDSVFELSFNPTGSTFAASFKDKDGTLRFWDMHGPQDADPLILRRNIVPYGPKIFFHPTLPWAVVPYQNSVAFWPLNHSYPYVLHGRVEVGGAESLNFTRDGTRLVCGFNAKGIQVWDINNLRAPSRDLWKAPSEIHRIELDGTGKYVVAGTLSHRVYVISLADGSVRQMPESQHRAFLNASISSDGRFVAAYTESAKEEIHLWNTETDRVQMLKGTLKIHAVGFSPDGKLYSGDDGGNLAQWDLTTGTSRVVAKGSKRMHYLTFVRNAPHLIICLWTDMESVDYQKSSSELRILDMQTGRSRLITSHGDRLSSVATDPAGTVLVTGDMDGIVRFGPITGEEPHLLFGHRSVWAVAVDPDRRWIASSEDMDPVVRLWPIPKGKPLHTLPHDEFLKKLQSLTNVRAVADQTSATGYRIQFDPFPGWEKVPSW